MTDKGDRLGGYSLLSKAADSIQHTLTPVEGRPVFAIDIHCIEEVLIVIADARMLILPKTID